MISVVVCTHNRLQALQEVLAGLREQSLPVDAFEVVVVDNASTDGTQELVQSLRSEASNIGYLFESRIGLSIARNTGAAASRAAAIAYLDDDAIPGPRWLEELHDAFETLRPLPAAVGGPVRLQWEGDLDFIAPDRFLSLYSSLDHGEVTRNLGNDEHLVGANLAVRADRLSELGGFATSLGRHGGQLLSGEEALLLHRIRARGWGVGYAAQAAVRHLIPAERQRRSWLAKRVFWDGASQPILDRYTAAESGGAYLARPRVLYDLRVFLGRSLSCLVPFAGKDASFDRYLRALHRAGRLRTEILMMLGRV